MLAIRHPPRPLRLPVFVQEPRQSGGGAGSSPSPPGGPQPHNRLSGPERSCFYFEPIIAPWVVPPFLIELDWVVRSAPLDLSAYFPGEPSPRVHASAQRQLWRPGACAPAQRDGAQ